MDIQRPDVAMRKRRKRMMWTTIGVLALAFVTVAGLRMEPAAPKVERGSVWIGEVNEGPLVLEVRGIGTFVPEDQRWITAQTLGSVDHIRLLPGVTVEPESVIIELTNPELRRNLRNAEFELASVEAALENQRVREEDSLLEMEFQLAQLNASHENAQLDVRLNEELHSEGLIAERDLLRSRVSEKQWSRQKEILSRRIASRRRQMEQNLAPAIARVEQERDRVALLQRQVDHLQVRAGIHGILQRLPLQEGQQVDPGAQLAQVADPSRLKAVIRVPETQAKDIRIGQPTRVDNRNGVVEGTVARIDPAVEGGQVNVDVSLVGSLPPGARADQTVEGRIELEKLSHVVYVSRPAFGREFSTVAIFVLSNDNAYAERRQVTFGRGSGSGIEVTSGLRPGERVILSDTTEWDDKNRLRLN